MYYEECVIDGVLHWRGTPTAKWMQCTQARLSFLLTEARNELQSEKARADAAEARFAWLAEKARCAPDMGGNHRWWTINLPPSTRGPTLAKAIDAALLSRPADVEADRNG